MGNTLTAEFAKASIVAEQLGKDNITDFLAISFRHLIISAILMGPILLNPKMAFYD